MFNDVAKTIIFPNGDGWMVVLNRELFPRRLIVSSGAIRLAVEAFVAWLDREDQRLGH